MEDDIRAVREKQRLVIEDALRGLKKEYQDECERIFRRDPYITNTADKEKTKIRKISLRDYCNWLWETDYAEQEHLLQMEMIRFEKYLGKYDFILFIA